MLTIYHSNQLDLLKSMLVKLQQVQPLADPFACEQILVQSPGMAQWLKLELAQAFGIVANVQFPLPASFIWEMFTRVLPDMPSVSPFNKGAMSWQLMVLLPGLLSRPAFAPLASYLSPNGEAPEQVRLWQLCEQIADLFDQYLVYRPDWIASWEAGGGLAAELDGVEGQAWQPELWRELHDRILARAPSGYHRANLYADFIAALSSGAQLPAPLPARIFVFGISALPPRYVEALHALGQRIDVHLFVTNPCQHYWGDILDRNTLARLQAKVQTKMKPGTLLESYQGPVNPLLASMGKQGRDYLQQLWELEVNEITAFVDPLEEQENLLAYIQHDILQLVERDAGLSPLSRGQKQAIAATDGSLQIHACHSAMREVEVLHDRLLALFDADPTLTPKDVVVMMPDVNAYTPAIQAVFGAKGLIPFSISDRSASQENPILLSLLSLLRLPDSRLGAAELLAILEVPAVLRRFELEESAFHQLRQWVAEAGIRWGLDAEYACRFDLPPLAGNSWLFGLRRLLLGFAMGEGDPVAGILPYAELEGQMGVWLGKLAAFIDALARHIEPLSQEAEPGIWRQRVLLLLEEFYLPDEEDERVLELVRRLLVSWQERLDEAGFAGLISPDLFVELMKQGLSGERGSQRFLAGQVNFCTLMPMRSIPFRQICLLGMNDGVYPRSLAPMGFDLIAMAGRRGDRSRREDDRYLFLEAILSARSGLYISYQGFSVQDGSEKVPSVLLAELLDYCTQGFCLAGDESLDSDTSAKNLLAHLVVNHPLTPYSPSYFYPEPGSLLFTYGQEWLPALSPRPGAANFQSQPLPLPEEWGEQLELAELLRFFRNPAAYFLNRRLKVWFEPLEAGLEESEPFSLDGLERYLIKQQLLEQHLAGETTASSHERLRLCGLLPHGAFGELLLEQSDEEMSGLAQQILPWWQQEITTQEVAIALPQGTLQGWLPLRGGRLVIYKPGKLRGKDLLSGWIQHLALCCVSTGARTLLFDLEHSWQFVTLPADEASQLLAELVASWQQGMARPLPFFANTASEWFEAMAGGDEQKAQTRAYQCFEGGFNSAAEGDDPYIARCFPELDEVTFAAMTKLAAHHLPALYQALQPLAGEESHD